MSTHNIHLKYRTLKRFPTIISIMPPDVALLVTFRGSNYRSLSRTNFHGPKGVRAIEVGLYIYLHYVSY